MNRHTWQLLTIDSDKEFPIALAWMRGQPMYLAWTLFKVLGGSAKYHWNHIPRHASTHCRCSSDHVSTHCRCSSDHASTHCRCSSEHASTHCRCSSEHASTHCSSMSTTQYLGFRLLLKESDCMCLMSSVFFRVFRTSNIVGVRQLRRD